VLTDVTNELRDKGALDEEECFIDATFVRRACMVDLMSLDPSKGNGLSPSHLIFRSNKFYAN
jgi:hypothetical protein